MYRFLWLLLGANTKGQKGGYLPVFIVLLAGAFLGSCGNSPLPPYPRPLGYPRFELPQAYAYARFAEPNCPFTFDYPEFAEVSLFRPDSCWVDIYFPPFDCTWHFTYRFAKEGKVERDYSLEEHRLLIYKHSKKAQNISSSNLAHTNGYGTLYEVFGNVGTPSQVFYSDSTHSHILMTSFYYNSSLQNDSLAPLSQYMKGELQKMVRSIQWE